MIQPWTSDHPKKAFLYPTLLCNLSCSMCYSGSHHNASRLQEELLLEDYKRVIKELYEAGVRTFDISGGEPFLSKDIWAILEQIKSFDDTEIFIVNNGTRIRSVLPKLLGHLDLIDRLYVSIDSPIATEHNAIRGNKRAFQEALTGISVLREYGYDRLGVNMVVMSSNRSRVTEFLDFANEQQFRYVNLLRLIDVKTETTTPSDTPSESGMDQAYLDVFRWMDNYIRQDDPRPFEVTMVLPGGFYNAYLNSPRRRTWSNSVKFNVEFDPIRGCPAFGNSIIVSSSGEVTGCTAFITQSVFQTGNVKTDSIRKTLERWPEYTKLLREREQYLKTVEPCSTCEHWNVCRGGCPATAYKYYGTVMRSDPTCIKAQQT